MKSVSKDFFKIIFKSLSFFLVWRIQTEAIVKSEILIYTSNSLLVLIVNP